MLERIIEKIRRILGLSEIKRYKMKLFLKSHQNVQQIDNNKIKETLTLIIPCFNHEPHLDKCFESILKQTRKPDEIIFINNKSQDKTKEKIEEYIKKYDKTLNIKLINNEKNMGQAWSINTAVKTSNSNYIMLLCDDDYLFPEATETILNQFKINPELAMVGATTVYFNDDNKISEKLDEKQKLPLGKITIHTPKIVKDYRNNNDLNMTHTSSVFLKSVWEEVGGFYPNKMKRMVLFSDRDFQLRVALLHPVGVLMEKPLSFWRTDSSVDSGINS